MQPLDVILVHANPIRFASRDQLLLKSVQHMLDSGVRVTLVECAYGDRPFLAESTNPHINFVGVRAKSLVWNKENLINVGLSRLKAGWKYVAWIDADIEFRKVDWAHETVHALQQYDIVQPWNTCYDLGPNDDHLQVHRSFCALVHHGCPIVQGPRCGPNTGYQFAHPGYAWAATRAALEWTGGLIETAVLGAADHHMALALLGRVEESIPGNATEGYKTPLYQWQARALHHINGNIGYVPVTIEHAWHGRKADRAYIERWAVVTDNAFDPITDLKKNTFGVYELAGNKPKLRHDIDLYFRQRNEDGNVL